MCQRTTCDGVLTQKNKGKRRCKKNETRTLDPFKNQSVRASAIAFLAKAVSSRARIGGGGRVDDENFNVAKFIPTVGSLSSLCFSLITLESERKLLVVVFK